MAAKPKRPDDLDAIDRRILSALRADGRLTTQALAEKVGLSPSPCWTRVKRLEESGVIENYVAVLNHGALGFSNTVFVEVTLDKHDDKVLDLFGEALARTPEVIEAYLVTGDYDFLVKVVVSGTDHYERFLRETLYRLPGIRQTRTTFGLRALKRAISVDPLQMR
ncbi:Lrp/AsnC family transcriptional regulator [Bosea sp. 685]|uniref:Lrp/AsnC family transcriptional regulator n=1 Tax=Bosea sp. 685 TaxID=3080057 RepID=UPI00289311C0|nr:Lrp/AsnC family transcriptional regulator [Bosea sp. 685]WNJ91023.1 Lrp/AsnC family transcriptional regulator [Bosea sp. 685]